MGRLINYLAEISYYVITAALLAPIYGAIIDLVCMFFLGNAVTGISWADDWAWRVSAVLVCTFVLFIVRNELDN